jgi:beta-phosphoglucomutase-like phosphatase (HAD superfamily)
VSDASRAAVVFDLDGVIADTEPLQYASYADVLAQLGVRVTREEYGREWIGTGRGPEYAVRAYGLSVSPAELRARKSEVYRRRLRDDLRLMPGAPEALERLGERYPLGLATNLAADTAIVLERFDLRRRFSAVVTRSLSTPPAPDASRGGGGDSTACRSAAPSSRIRGAASPRAAGCASGGAERAHERAGLLARPPYGAEP